MIEVPTVKDVRLAWKAFNDLPMYLKKDMYRESASAVSTFKNREMAWLNYSKVRDHYLYSVGAISLTELNRKWYPRAAGYNQSSNRAQ